MCHIHFSETELELHPNAEQVIQYLGPYSKWFYCAAPVSEAVD